MPNSPLVSAAWLRDHLHSPDVVILDCSWFMPGEPRDPKAEYAERHIPGAVFFDVDDIADKNTDLPHMLPNADLFESKVSNLGISNSDTIIAYSQSDLHTAPRAWWMFRAMGHDKIYVLDGGMKAWLAAGGEVSDEPPAKPVSSFKATPNPTLLKTADKLHSEIQAGCTQIADARPLGRFDGTVPEPRAGLRSGHMPGACCLPTPGLYQPDGTLKPIVELQGLIKSIGLNLENPLVTSCGSGMMACNLALAFAVLGKWDTAVYDGSWTEWGGREDLPVVTG